MKTVWCALLLLASPALVLGRGLEGLEHLVVADHAPTRGGIRITYLGVNGYQFETAGQALVVDPYFSRLGLGTVAGNRRVAPDFPSVAAGLNKMRRRIEAVLVTHGHFDHMLDVPPIMRRTGAHLYADASTVELARACNIPERKCTAVKGGDVQRIGPWTVHVIAAQHDRLLGRVPYTGTQKPGDPPPARIADWVLGQPLAFIIEAAGRRIYLAAGGRPGALPPAQKVDLAIIGTALPDAREGFAATVQRLQPRFTLPSHQDDLFQPFDRGFIFANLSSFPEVVRMWNSERLPGRLILLEYFRPWTLP